MSFVSSVQGLDKSKSKRVRTSSASSCQGQQSRLPVMAFREVKKNLILVSIVKQS